MNAQLTMVKKSINLTDDSLEIYHSGFIETIEQYDWVMTVALRYLRDEGFLGGAVPESLGIAQLEPHPIVNNIHVFDYKGSLVIRESCR